MKFSIAALVLAGSAWAGPVASTGPVDGVLADLKARTDAAFYHAGPDLVLRAVSPDFQVVGTAALTERQAAEWHASLNQPITARGPFDEGAMVGAITAHARRAVPEELFDMEKRQSCFRACGAGTSPCSGGVRCPFPCCHVFRPLLT